MLLMCLGPKEGRRKENKKRKIAPSIWLSQSTEIPRLPTSSWKEMEIMAHPGTGPRICTAVWILYI